MELFVASNAISTAYRMVSMNRDDFVHVQHGRMQYEWDGITYNLQVWYGPEHFPDTAKMFFIGVIREGDDGARGLIGISMEHHYFEYTDEGDYMLYISEEAIQDAIKNYRARYSLD